MRLFLANLNCCSPFYCHSPKRVNTWAKVLPGGSQGLLQQDGISKAELLALYMDIKLIYWNAPKASLLTFEQRFSCQMLKKAVESYPILDKVNLNPSWA